MSDLLEQLSKPDPKDVFPDDLKERLEADETNTHKLCSNVYLLDFYQKIEDLESRLRRVTYLDERKGP